MKPSEKATIIGYHRNGMVDEAIAYIMGISVSYVKQIINEYLKNKKKWKDKYNGA